MERPREWRSRVERFHARIVTGIFFVANAKRKKRTSSRRARSPIRHSNPLALGYLRSGAALRGGAPGNDASERARRRTEIKQGDRLAPARLATVGRRERGHLFIRAASLCREGRPRTRRSRADRRVTERGAERLISGRHSARAARPAAECELLERADAASAARASIAPDEHAPDIKRANARRPLCPIERGPGACTKKVPVPSDPSPASCCL